EYVVQPHLAVELVEAVRQRRRERAAAAGGDLSADRGHTRRRDGHDKAGVVLANHDPVQRTDIDVLGIGWARMHAYPAAQDDSGVGFAHKLQGGTVGRVIAQTEADRRGAAAEG